MFDDDFMTKIFEEHPECIELVLRIIMDKPGLKVLDVRTQVFVENFLNCSVCLLQIRLVQSSMWRSRGQTGE